MTLQKALFEAGYYVRDGKVFDPANHSEVTEEKLRSISENSKRTLHDLYISPASTKYTNQSVRFDEAIDTILEFVALAPAVKELQRLGVTCSV